MIFDERRQNEAMYLWLILFFVGSLFILGIPYIAMLFLMIGAILFTAQFFATLRVDRHVAAFAGLLLYVLSWGLITGAFQFSNLVKPSFLGGEGRIIIAYMPLLLIFSAPSRLFSEYNISRIFRMMFYMAVVTLPLSLVGLSGTLFGSHHAAGYAAGSLLIAFTCLFSEEGKRWQRVGILVALLLLLMANSRTTIVGVICAFAIFYYHRLFSLKVIIGGAIAVVGLLYLWSFISPLSFARFSELFSIELWGAVAEQATAASSFDVLEAASVERTGTNWNILTRIILFVRAWGFFETSPILGIGSFRYNDGGLYLIQVMPGLTVGASNLDPDLSVATAHNSYLHVLAEGGLVGLGIYLAPWLMILMTLRKRRIGSPMQRSLRKMSIISILFMAFGALSGHLLAAPSMTLWVLCFSGLALRATARDRTNA